MIRKRLLGALLGAAMMTISTAAHAQVGVRKHVQNWTDKGDVVVASDGTLSFMTRNEMTSTGMHRVGSRSGAPLPCMGSPKIPVVLVQFSDLKFTAGKDDAEVNEVYHKTFNGSGIPGQPHRVSGIMYGAVSDYFIEQSDSLYQPEFTVIGPVTLSRGYAYYGSNGSGGDGADVNIGSFYNEACKLAIEGNTVTWDDFDNNNDGKVDFVFFIYAGYGENDIEHDDPNTIWPKEDVRSLTVTANEKSIIFGGYGCTNEMYNGHQDGIGTIVHELSHGLGLPDMYCTNSKAIAFGMDMFDCMDSGNYQSLGTMPCCYSAYEREFMGWRNMVTLPTDTAVTLTLNPIETDGVGYKIVNPANENEYFILENRQNLGFDYRYGVHAGNSEFNSYGACHGLLITHVDYVASSWSANTVNYTPSHQRMTPIPADGALLLPTNSAYYTSLRKDLYPAGGTALSSDATFAGTRMGITITDITENEDKTVTLKLNGGSPVPDGIENASAQKGGAAAIYSVNGVRLNALQPGLNIVRMSDGSVKKVVR